MKLRTKLLLSMLLVGILPVLLVTVYAGNKISRYVRDRQTAVMEGAATDFCRTLDLMFKTTKRDMKILATNPIMAQALFHDIPFGEASERLRYYTTEKDSPYSFLMLTNAEGVCEEASDERLQDKQNARKKWHRQTMKNGWYISDWNRRPPKAILSNPPYGGDYRYTMVFSWAIVDPDEENNGVFIGTINSRLKWQKVQKTLERTVAGYHQQGFHTQTLMIIQADGTIIGHEKGSAMYRHKIKEVIAEPANLEQLRREKQGYFVDAGHGQPLVCAFVTVDFGLFKWKVLTTMAKDEMFRLRNEFITALLLVCGFGILLAIGIGFLAGNRVVGPIKRASEMLKDIAEGDGDLTARLPVPSTGKKVDEIGELAVAFNTFVGKLQTIFQEVVGILRNLNDSATGFTAMAAELSTRADEAAGRANAVATAAEELNANMNSVAAAVEQASVNTSQVATAAEGMNTTFGEISTRTREAGSVTDEAVSRAHDATDKVAKLGEAAGRIGAIIETITSISSQTNLLALNATIEAARAGEAGKGFAVVANEIKDLAQQTATATEEIKAQVEGIRSSVGGTVEGIEQISGVIDQVSEIVSTIVTAIGEQVKTNEEISINISQASTGINKATENVAQSSEVSGQVAGDIAVVNEAVGEITNSGTQVKLTADELAHLAATLQKLVGQFKL